MYMYTHTTQYSCMHARTHTQTRIIPYQEYIRDISYVLLTILINPFHMDRANPDLIRIANPD